MFGYIEAGFSHTFNGQACRAEAQLKTLREAGPALGWKFRAKDYDAWREVLARRSNSRSPATMRRSAWLASDADKIA